MRNYVDGERVVLCTSLSRGEGGYVWTSSLIPPAFEAVPPHAPGLGGRHDSAGQHRHLSLARDPSHTCKTPNKQRASHTTGLSELGAGRHTVHAVARTRTVVAAISHNDLVSEQRHSDRAIEPGVLGFPVCEGVVLADQRHHRAVRPQPPDPVIQCVCSTMCNAKHRTRTLSRG